MINSAFDPKSSIKTGCFFDGFWSLRWYCLFFLVICYRLDPMGWKSPWKITTIDSRKVWISKHQGSRSQIKFSINPFFPERKRNNSCHMCDHQFNVCPPNKWALVKWRTRDFTNYRQIWPPKFGFMEIIWPVISWADGERLGSNQEFNKSTVDLTCHSQKVPRVSICRNAGVGGESFEDTTICFYYWGSQNVVESQTRW